jgi:hypothetical protein
MEDLEEAEGEIQATFIVDPASPEKNITSQFKMEKLGVGSVEAFLIRFAAPTLNEDGDAKVRTESDHG